jgi:hypothetical protein
MVFLTVPRAFEIIPGINLQGIRYLLLQGYDNKDKAVWEADLY